MVVSNNKYKYSGMEYSKEELDAFKEEYISKFDVLDATDKLYNHGLKDVPMVWWSIRIIPEADVVPPSSLNGTDKVHEANTGIWSSYDAEYYRKSADGELNKYINKVYYCPFCGRKSIVKENYCPSCGAKLK